MTISPRLTRAALTFLLFGTVAALLPSQDTTAIADVGCTLNPQYKMRLAPFAAVNPSQVSDPATINRPSQVTIATYISKNGGTSYSPLSHFSGRILTYSLTNTSASGTLNIGAKQSATYISKNGGTSYSPALVSNFSGRILTNTSASGTLNIGAKQSDNPVAAGTSLNYLPADDVSSTGIYASQTAMTGKVTVQFQYSQITLVDSRSLISK